MGTHIVARDDSTGAHTRRRSGRSRLLATAGPAFVAAVAYIDPGNFATNFAGGFRHGYHLVWAIVAASIAATVVQFLSSKTGLVTGRSLPELCRERFSRKVNRVLWVQAEIVAMVTDLAEFVGAAVGLHLVFGLPLLPAGGVTAVVAFIILALERNRSRRFVAAIAALFFVVVGAFVYLAFDVGRQRFGELGKGLVPMIHNGDELTLVVAIVGATVMPHIVYAHSALQTHQDQSADVAVRHRRVRYNLWDCVAALGIAGAVNAAMLCIAAALPTALTASDGNLTAVHEVLQKVGGGAALAFGIALIASGFASSTVGTYAGQVVMAGFVQRRVPILARRLITMVPSLIVLAVAVEPTRALVFSQLVLSFCIPFALVPLILVSCDARVMRDQVNRWATTALACFIAGAIIALNLYLIVSTFL